MKAASAGFVVAILFFCHSVVGRTRKNSPLLRPLLFPPLPSSLSLSLSFSLILSFPFSLKGTLKNLGFGEPLSFLVSKTGFVLDFEVV